MGIQSYDHANVIVRREMMQMSVAGATQVTAFAFFQKSRVKAVHILPRVAGTSNTGVQVIAQVSGTVTTALGTNTLGTRVTSAGLQSNAVGTTNAPAGITFLPGDELRLTNAVDATAVFTAIVEYEVLPDANRT